MKFDKMFKSVVHTQDNLSDVETKVDVFKGKEPKKVNTVVHTQEENMVAVQEIMEDNDFSIEEKENQAPQQGRGNKIQFVRPNQQINDGSLMDFFKRQQQLQMASEISRRTEQTTVQMLVEASLRNQEEAKKREEKLLALLERRS